MYVYLHINTHVCVYVSYLLLQMHTEVGTAVFELLRLKILCLQLPKEDFRPLHLRPPAPEITPSSIQYLPETKQVSSTKSDNFK